MKDVIEFPMNRTTKPKIAEGRAPAEVVIFPGVRIERPGFNLADRITPSNSRAALQTQIKEVENF